MSNLISLDKQNTDLIEVAREAINKRHHPKFHEIGAALRTKSGKIFSAVHLEAGVGRIAVCAEAIAIGIAAMARDTDIDVIVAVNSKGEVVSPCGMCRELISDYSADAKIVIKENDNYLIIPVLELLPHKYDSNYFTDK